MTVKASGLKAGEVEKAYFYLTSRGRQENDAIDPFWTLPADKHFDADTIYAASPCHCANTALLEQDLSWWAPSEEKKQDVSLVG